MSDKKGRRTFSKEFKISILRELEAGKNAAEVCRENNIHESMLSKWKQEYKSDPRTAFSGKGNVCKLESKLAESERLIGKLYSENALLKKVLSSLEIKLRENQKCVQVS